MDDVPALVRHAHEAAARIGFPVLPDLRNALLVGTRRT